MVILVGCVIKGMQPKLYVNFMKSLILISELLFNKSALKSPPI